MFSFKKISAQLKL